MATRKNTVVIPNKCRGSRDIGHGYDKSAPKPVADAHELLRGWETDSDGPPALRLLAEMAARSTALGRPCEPWNLVRTLYLFDPTEADIEHLRFVYGLFEPRWRPWLAMAAAHAVECRAAAPPRKDYSRLVGNLPAGI